MYLSKLGIYLLGKVRGQVRTCSASPTVPRSPTRKKPFHVGKAFQQTQLVIGSLRD